MRSTTTLEGNVSRRRCGICGGLDLRFLRGPPVLNGWPPRPVTGGFPAHGIAERPEKTGTGFVKTAHIGGHGFHAQGEDHLVTEVNAVSVQEIIPPTTPQRCKAGSDQIADLPFCQVRSAQVDRLPEDVHRVASRPETLAHTRGLRVRRSVERPLLAVDLDGCVEGTERLHHGVVEDRIGKGKCGGEVEDIEEDSVWGCTQHGALKVHQLGNLGWRLRVAACVPESQLEVCRPTHSTKVVPSAQRPPSVLLHILPVGSSKLDPIAIFSVPLCWADDTPKHVPRGFLCGSNSDG
mmetsp:Transcript_65146/g.172578  ORF Transcript_65146/g.172578 Transcript_65146/m.172578 type:complete len:293 (+) Transcript_65146:242-1120(+)